MISQFECQIGAMYMSKLDQDSTTGALSVAANSLKFIDQSPEFGGFVHCAGQTTPWNSHLGSEEYETDARMVEADADISGITGDKYYDETAMFWSTDSSKDDATKLNPYYYGWTPEVQVDGSTDAITYMKHYSMGRFSHELAYVMPDQKRFIYQMMVKTLDYSCLLQIRQVIYLWVHSMPQNGTKFLTQA